MNQAVSAEPVAVAVDWRRNLAVLWIAIFASVLGVTFTFPFMPLFLSHDLNIHDPHNLALWSGLTVGASGIGQAISSPLWGAAGDRWGRKPMVIRALACGAFLSIVTSFVQDAPQLAALRFLNGAFAGTIPTAVALATTETPRHRTGWSVGVIWSAVAFGSASGPLIASVVVATLGVRWMYVVGGIVIGLTILPVSLIVRESQRRISEVGGNVTIRGLRRAPGGIFMALVALMVAQLLVQAAISGAQPMFSLRLLALEPSRAASIIGIAFAALGGGTAIAALAYATVAGRIGHRASSLIAALAASVVVLVGAATSNVLLIVGALAVFGLAQGILQPSVSSMAGLEAPVRLHATVFGLMATSFALGTTLGPVLNGVIAAWRDPPTAMVFSAGLAVLLFGLVALVVREPRKVAE